MYMYVYMHIHAYIHICVSNSPHNFCSPITGSQRKKCVIFTRQSVQLITPMRCNSSTGADTDCSRCNFRAQATSMVLGTSVTPRVRLPCLSSCVYGRIASDAFTRRLFRIITVASSRGKKRRVLR